MLSSLLIPILADAGEFPVKVVFGIIVLVLWGIGALANVAKQQQSQQEVKRRAALERSIREQAELTRRRESAAGLGPTNRPVRGPSMPPLAAPPPLMQGGRPRGPAVPPVRNRAAQQPPRRQPGAPPAIPAALRSPLPQQRQRQQQQNNQAQRRRPPAAPEARRTIVAPADSAVPTRPGVLETEIGQGAAPASPARRAAAALSAEMPRLTPTVLRQQFILTEILQPPLALRDHPREDDDTAAR